MDAEKTGFCKGIRPINNMVDITNYVMEEYGQPMHAYDLIQSQTKNCNSAEEGEKFTTLDGQERTMDENVLMICDGEKSIGIAGIMGGENSMVQMISRHAYSKQHALTEQISVLSSKRIGLRTDASGKFEKGLDPKMQWQRWTVHAS